MIIASYNILKGGEDRWENILGVVHGIRPDVLALQECNGWENCIEHRQNEMGFRGGCAELCCGTPTKSGNRYHVVTASRIAPVSSFGIRGMHHAALETVYVTSAGELSIVNCHLDPHSSYDRLRELENIVARQTGRDLAIIVGDMNMLSEHDEYPVWYPRDFSDGLRKTFLRDGRLVFDESKFLQKKGYHDVAVLLGKNQHATMPTALSEHDDGLFFRVDYCWALGDTASLVECYKVFEAPEVEQASDHRPIVVVLNAESVE